MKGNTEQTRQSSRPVDGTSFLGHSIKVKYESVNLSDQL